MTNRKNATADRDLGQDPDLPAVGMEAPKPAKEGLGTAFTGVEYIKARLAEIEAAFKNSNRSYLDRSKLALEYRDKYLALFPQHEEKKKRGRPGIVKAMALKLEAPGDTPKAREVWLTRALKIASLSPDVIEAAKEAKLDRNQSALLKIVACSADKQLQVIKEIQEVKFNKPATRRLEKGKAKATIVFPQDRASEVRKLLIQFAQDNELEVIGDTP